MSSACGTAIAISAAVTYCLLLSRSRRSSPHAWVAELQRQGKLGTLHTETQLAVDLALQCGAAMLATSGAQVTWKDDGGIDPVTATDQANEELVTQTLARAFPAHRIIGEEAAAAGDSVPLITLTDGPTWYVDPIDGTQNFVHSLPLSCVSIGLAVGGVPVLGVIYHPQLDELFVGLTAAATTPPLGAEAHGSYLNGRRLQADTKNTALGSAMVLTDVGYERSAAGVRRIGAVLTRLLSLNVRAVRMVGSSALCVAWVAAGRASAFYAGLHTRDTPKQWDWCAGHAIATAAGVVFVRHGEDTRPFDIDGSAALCAGTPQLAAELKREIEAALAAA